MQGALIEALVNNYLKQLYRGEAELPPDLVETFADNLKNNFLTIREQSNDGKFTLRMSSLGKPLCQLQMEASGVVSQPVDEQTLPAKFATGDMLEQWLVMILKASGVPVRNTDIPAELPIYGANIKGTADIDIDGKIYDIKSASNYGFNKYGPSGGFSAVYDNDPFGYVTQGYLYSTALAKPFGGWIVINKNNGHITVCETPDDDAVYAKEALSTAEANVKAISEDAPFERCFEDVEETFRKKPTGNRVLCTTCEWCGYKQACWDNLEYRPQVMSKAISPKWTWYTELNYVPEEEEETANESA